MKKAVIALALLLLLGPFIGLLAIGVLMNPAANAECTIDGSGITVGNIPDSLNATTANGETITLNRQQLTHAATIIEIGSGIDGVGRDGIQIALMAALTESSLRMLSNTPAYPESADYPNDGNGADHDSLGLFQMRPASGWGTVADLMDSTYQARAFYGGPDGPNYPSPRGLLDIPGWQQMGKGEAAQAVEVSAYPDRYNNYEPVALTILGTLTGSGGPATISAGAQPVTVASEIAETSRVVFPLPEGTWVATDPFGPRVHPITGEDSFHTGADFAAPDGTPILAAASGTVTVAEFSGGYGGLVVIEHRIDGRTVATAYAHSWQNGIHVSVGDQVRAGQHIADVGSSGMSTGPHLHFEVRDGGTSGEFIDPAAWLNQHDAADLPEAEVGPPNGCGSSTGAAGDPAPFDDDDPNRMAATTPMAGGAALPTPIIARSKVERIDGQKIERPSCRAEYVALQAACASDPVPKVETPAAAGHCDPLGLNKHPVCTRAVNPPPNPVSAAEGLGSLRERNDRDGFGRVSSDDLRDRGFAPPQFGCLAGCHVPDGMNPCLPK